MPIQHIAAAAAAVSRDFDPLLMAQPIIKVEGDGSIVAVTALERTDTNAAATAAAVISEELRVSKERIRVEPVETVVPAAARAPFPCAVSLRSTAVAIRAYLLQRASSYFDVDSSELFLNDGRVITFDGRAMTYQELSRTNTVQC